MPAFAGTTCEGAIADRRVVINADDFGLCEGVTRGIVEAHQAGAVTAASMFANAPGFGGAVQAARQFPRLDLGLHFNLTVGAPVSPPARVPSLCATTGLFRSLGPLIRRALSGRVDPDDVARECRAQLDRLRAAGVRVSHLDGHRHAHVLPGVWSGVEAVGRSEGIPVRRPVEPVGPGRMAAKLALRIACVIAMPGPTPSSHHFRGIGLLGARDFGDALVGLLDRSPAGVTEVAVHPGYVDADLLRWDSYAQDRERELAALRSPHVLTRLTRGDPRLVRFADL
ncbi:MAG TPA: ChbG/HpnK family deacetylase [Gemmatimonadales bacterium]|nr:ChbG/HpnK family deacetylase [Gemmatimonadales bacterium]